MKRVHLVVRGRVQGVWYRASTRDEAARLGLVGWVRNLSDGGVEVVAEGEPEPLARLVAWCRRGPPHARVDAVEEDWSEAEGGLTSFRVTH